MKKWIVRISFICSLMASLVTAISKYPQFLHPDFQATAFSKISQILFYILVLFTIVFTGLTLSSFLSDKIIRLVERITRVKKSYWGMVVFLGLIVMEAVQDLLYLNADLKPDFYPTLLVENKYLLLWAAVVFGQGLLCWLLLGLNAGAIQLPRLSELPLWALAGIVVGGIVLYTGGQGSLPSNAPIPALHIFIALVTVMGGWLLIRLLNKKSSWLTGGLKQDLLVLAVLWAGAFFLWSNAPLQTNYFIGAPRAPNYQFTPTSDAIYYEIQAQRLLVGEGFEDLVQHSFYGYLVSGMHFVGGENYLDIYRLQIALLAFTPFLLYKLASLLHSRFSGWLLSLLFIIREWNALHLGDSITVSNVQELMTEPLALVGVALFLYLSILWMKDRSDNRGLPVLIGCVIGLTALVRVELLSLSLVFGLTLLIKDWKVWKNWLIPGLFLLVGLMMTLTPWVIRNYQKTGALTIDKGKVIETTVQSYLSQQAPESSQAEMTVGQLVNQGLDRVIKKLISSSRRSTTSLKQSLVYLPSNYFPLGGIDDFVKIIPEKRRVIFFQNGLFSDIYLTHYIKSLPYWEMNWKGAISPRSFLPQLLVVLLIAGGIHQSWKRLRWVGMLPLLAMLAHILVYAVLRGSGGRYIQVVDWITLLYLCLGLTEAVSWVVRQATGTEMMPNIDKSHEDSYNLPDAVKAPSRWRGLGWSIVIILVAGSMPVVESVIPQRYTEYYLENKLQQLSDDLQDNALLSSGDQEPYWGKALYPRYFTAEEKFVDDRAGRMPDVGLDQVVFYLVGKQNIWVSLPVDKVPEYFPHGSDIIVWGQITRDTEEDLQEKLLPYLEADQVVVFPPEEDGSLVQIYTGSSFSPYP
jgi:hypothetical protein